jgi:integrase
MSVAVRSRGGKNVEPNVETGSTIMGKGIHRLNALKIRNRTEPGWLCDGGGLYLAVKNADSKSWVFRYTTKGKVQYMGLGSLRDVTMQEAREQAEQCRKMHKHGRGANPIAARRAAVKAAEVAESRQLTFEECAKRYLAVRSPGWRGQTIANHELLQRHAYPAIGDVPVQMIDTPDVMRVLTPMWNAGIAKTGYTLVGMMERVLDWATTSGYREGDNPARWRRHLEHLLAKPNKIKPVQHHPSMPYEDVPEFMHQLDKVETTAARALEFIVLTTVRAREGADARWSEFNSDRTLWTIPASRMKTHKPFAVPLSPAVRDVLKRAEKLYRRKGNDLVFPGPRTGKGIDRWNITELVRACSKDPAMKYTTHGFRSSFRTWAEERTRFRWEVRELALSHLVGGAVERSYSRTDLIEEQRRLKDQWAAYCTSPPVAVSSGKKVVPLKRQGGAND